MPAPAKPGGRRAETAGLGLPTAPTEMPPPELAPGLAAAETAAASDQRRDHLRRLQGIGLMCLAIFCFAILDTSAKWLGRDYHPLQTTFARYFVALVLIVAFLNPWTQKGAWTTRRPWLQTLRGFLLFGSTIFNFMAIRELQLAETMSIAFATPFLIALLSGPVLGEWIGIRRWIAILIGFGGVLVITQPGMAGFKPAMLWSFASVFCYATYAITTRILSGVDSTASMLVISAAIPVLLLGPVMPGVWQTPPDWLGWALMLTVGASGAIGHFFLIRAYTIAPAPVVAPFIYTQIVYAAVLGWFVFGDIPGLNTVVGGLIVIASGLYLIWRETVVKRTG